MQVKIYALINPINSNVFYIGATSGKLYIRLSAHLTCKNNNRKYSMVTLIKSLGLRPEMLLLDTVNKRDAAFYEQFYMDLFRSFGFDIVNKRKSNYTNLYS